MSKDLELFLFKNKLNEVSLMDLMNKFSLNTIRCIMKDLDVISEVKENKMYIFCDGGAKKNGKKGACAAYSILFNNDKDHPLFKFNKTEKIIGNQTNNVAELTGVLEIFRVLDSNVELFKDKDKNKDKTIVIVSDSQYSIDCVEKWSKNWLKNGWKNSKNEVVKNKEIIQEILLLKEKCNLKVEFKHVNSHTVEPKDKKSLEYLLWFGNNYVDSKINELI